MLNSLTVSLSPLEFGDRMWSLLQLKRREEGQGRADWASPPLIQSTIQADSNTRSFWIKSIQYFMITLSVGFNDTWFRFSIWLVGRSTVAIQTRQVVCSGGSPNKNPQVESQFDGFLIQKNHQNDFLPDILPDDFYLETPKVTTSSKTGMKEW